jgi:hypothetical protein
MVLNNRNSNNRNTIVNGYLKIGDVISGKLVSSTIYNAAVIEPKNTDQPTGKKYLKNNVIFDETLCVMRF